jgi:site-specific DNA recombinase
MEAYMIAALYIRVSTQEQAEKGDSIASQLEQCHEKAKLLGLSLTEEFIDDGYSGAYLERPALERLREGIRQKRFTYVIVYDPDRLARNLTHQLIITDEIEASGAKLEFVNFNWENTPEGRLFYSMRGAISAYEREKIKQRTVGGKKRKAKEGKVVKDAKPYGYSWDEKNSTYVINEEEAAAIKEIFRCIVEERKGLRAVAERIASLGFITRKGKTNWRYNTIHGIVHNEIYSGTHWANKRYKTKVGQNKSERGIRDPVDWIAVPVPPIISRELQDAALEQLKLNRNETKRPREYPYLCRGFVVCGICGGRMRSLTNGNWNKTNPIPYYICQTGRNYLTGSFGGNDEKCSARSVPALELDDYAWNKLSRLLKDKDALLKEFSSREQDDGAIAVLRNNLGNLNSKESQLIREQEKIAFLFRQDLLNQESTEKQLSEIKLALNSIIKSKGVLESEIARLDSSKEMRQTIDKFQSLAHLADSDDLDEKRMVIKALVKAVEVVRTDNSNGGKTHKLALKTKIRF